jgi:hypothetical protein
MAILSTAFGASCGHALFGIDQTESPEING